MMMVINLERILERNSCRNTPRRVPTNGVFLPFTKMKTDPSKTEGFFIAVSSVKKYKLF